MARRSAAAHAIDQGGFTVMELMVVIGLIGVIMAISSPFLLSYLRTSALRAGAEEMTTVLHRARQLAISDNTSMCVTNDGTRVQYRIGSCGGTIRTGPGTSGAGFIQLANDITVGPNGQNVVFTYLGTATTVGAYTVTNPRDGRTLRVVVSPSGRVSIAP
jgi:prepilin-type N-terminal cleavage/methylation domain-containing protein